MRRTIFPGMVAATLVAASLSVATGGASAATTVSPAEAGDPPVVRSSSVTVDVDRTAMTFYRGSSGAAFAPQSAAAVALGLTACRGDQPNGNSPRTTLKVTGPGGVTLTDLTSPVRDTSLGAFLTSPTNQPRTDNPGPSSTNYRGDFPDAGAFHGLKTTLDLTGQPAGIYTVTTTHTNKVKTGLFGGCATGTPVSNGAGGFTNAAPAPGDQVITQTFDYRPWQANFTDILGAGAVSANIVPAEFTFSIGQKSAAVYQGTGSRQTFYGLPSGGFALPSDPAACAGDPSSCLPATAVPCDPASGCTPRVMVINKPSTAGDRDNVFGVFDLDTKAFVATATVDGSTRALFSLGTVNDSVYGDLLAQLAAGAAAQGIDLASILATEVSVGNGQARTSLSLLNGLQIDPSSAPGGLQISTGATAQAGVFLHLYSSLRLSGGACVANSASSGDEVDRFTPNEDNGYTVTKSDLLPEVPQVGPLGALVGGPLYLIKGRFNDDALANVATAPIGVDTATNEPNGYPVWVQPFLSGINTTEPRTMEYLGTGTWSASESPLGQGCLVVNFLLGTGVALFDNPLPVGLGTLLDPLSEPNAAAAELNASVSDLVDQVTSEVTTLPVVADLLDQIVGFLPLDALA
ncbi:hypothetical protein HMPREF0063_10961 [Aeromicrobium marinum DSM 15272]|uniref:Uncharacterized protein n=1 Tax=Aeromicrobium marinum DSM 15272 TaxID=585531 RepID=E2SAH1_9ACTN|nr:hypothetical protein [Aeromicrobium marinum]EFQ84245.1 hypothetical protein HMPREF0063_10961 [Aeromicrobium marinum DSM 15272]